jgi:SAM-dependent methyltransferase
MDKQVDRSHYAFSVYMDKQRWASVWHQLDEVLRLRPQSVLEIGPGTGLFKAAAGVFGLDVKTLDIARDLQPDHVGPADAIPLPDKSMDVACAFQVLEHMPFDMSMRALREMGRVARKAVVISLPDAKVVWPSTVKIPLLKTRRLMLPNPLFRAKEHVFDGEHYWEINKREHPLKSVMAAMHDVFPEYRIRTYRVHENPYHRFFIFTL